MNRRYGLGLLIAGLIVLFLGATVVSSVAYNAGLAQGAQTAVLSAAQDGAAAPRVVASYAFPAYPRPFGFGLGFGLLGLLIVAALVFGAFRMIGGMMWRGRMGMGMGWRRFDGDAAFSGRPPFGSHSPFGMRGEGMPAMFEEWHRRAHAQAEQPSEPPKAGSAGSEPKP